MLKNKGKYTDLDTRGGNTGLSGRFGCKIPALSKLLDLPGGIGFLGGTWGATGLEGFCSTAALSSVKIRHQDNV